MNTSKSIWKFRSPRIVTSVALLASLTVGAGVAHAEEAKAEGGEKSNVRYDRKSSKVKTKESLDTKFKEEKERQEKEAKRKTQMMEGTSFAKKREAVAQQIADQQIEQLKRLLNATDPSDPEYADLLFRLADHFLEKKAYFELQSGALYEEIFQAEESGNKAKAGQLTAKQKEFDKKSKEASEQAVKLYKALTTSPALSKYKRIDEALYFYAFELGALGREQEMKDAYVQLIQSYPNSQYIPNAYLSFADYYFGKGQIGDALRLYEKVITFKDSPVYAYALYKMAWCHLNPIGTAEPRYDLSLQYFVNTITATLEGRAGSEANAKQLRRDARRDLVRAFVMSGKPSKAWEFFQKVGDGPKEDENMSRKMMELLAVQYFGQGMYTESTYTYHKLQELFPDDPQTCEWQGRVVINALATDNKDVQWTETSRLGEYWEKFKNGNQKEAIKRKCRDETLDTMKQMATVWHDEAEKTKNEGTYALAEKAYEGFLKTFPKDKDAYEIQMFYAELLWARAGHLVADKKTKPDGLNKFRKAHDEFVKVLEINPEGKFTQDAAFAQMLAMKNALEYDETGGQRPDAGDEERARVRRDRRPGQGLQDQLRGRLRLRGEGEEEEAEEDQGRRGRRLVGLPGVGLHRGREGDARGVRHLRQVREEQGRSRAAQDHVPPGEAHDDPQQVQRGAPVDRGDRHEVRRQHLRSLVLRDAPGHPHHHLDEQEQHPRADPQGLRGPRDLGQEADGDEGLQARGGG